MKKDNKSTENGKKNLKIIITVAAAGVILAAMLGIVFAIILVPRVTEYETVQTDSEAEGASSFAPVDTEIILTDEKSETEASVEGYESIETALSQTDIGNGLTLVSIGTYSGEFIENGSDSEVENVMSIVVRNDSDKNIQYAEISVAAGDDFYNFSLTTLPIGSSVFLLEIAKKEYDAEKLVRYAFSDSVAVFPKGMDLMTDKFTVSGSDNYIMVTNNTDADFNGAVTVYYKQTKDDQYFGGITYSATAQNGVKAGKSVVIPSDHFKIDTSKLMFVTVSEDGR